MITIDASAWVLALADRGAIGEAARGQLAADGVWIAPSHCPLEVIRTLLRQARAGLIDDARAKALVDFVMAADVAYIGPESWLLDEVWRLRQTISVYDAPYVALAQKHDCPLITADRRLARAATAIGVKCHVIGPQAD